MKKTSDEELNLWRYQDKRAPVSLSILGDSAIAHSYMGEAKALLWSVKNALRLNKQMQGEGEAKFDDGTTIRVKSVYGFDIVEIDASATILAPGVAIGPQCSITLISFPLSVPPMKDPGIAMGLPGVDYFKSYYSVDLKNCPTCQEIAWDFEFTYAKPSEPRHYINPYLPDGDPLKDQPNNHSVYSLYPSSFGEIIDHDQDGGGTYIIWKAYTEGRSARVFSRTGLGIMLLTAEISDLAGNIICNQQTKIDVDCCKKDSGLRNVEIWWEGVGTCEPFIIYNDKHICLMPTSVSIRMLITYSTPFYAAQPLYAIPEIKGGCIPLEWTVSGPIKLLNTGPYGTATYFQITSDPGDCFSPVSIILTDRCGTSYRVNGRPCCDDAGPLSINYTSLLMSCSQQQTFSALGGCAPYTWAVTSGGGTIDQAGNYTAPATNADCANNPTIQVTDCCGNTAQISLAINCYTPSISALVHTIYSEKCPVTPAEYSYCNNCGGGVPVCHVAEYHIIVYDCNGTEISDCDTGMGYPLCFADCAAGYNYHHASCFTSACGCGGASPCTCDALLDSRSSAMKSGGCCPLNPLTGLPY